MFFNLFLLNYVMKLSNYCCVLVYILQTLGLFDGDEMSDPPHDLGVDPDDYDHEMADAPDQDEADGTT